MLLHIRDITQSDLLLFYYLDLKLKFFLAIASAFGYGMVVVLSGNCFHLLQKKRRIYSNRMRILLLIYVTVMFLCSTLSLIGSVFLLLNALTDLDPSLIAITLDPLGPYALLVTTWGADGFMVRMLLVLRQEHRFTMQL